MTIFHDPPRSYGNCFSACLASWSFRSRLRRMFRS